jgi:nicotinate-nucleotide--dimethylbenzimidazole phosphoribosyltransferase
MSRDGWKSVLILGGIRSGKSEFAESLVSNDEVVRYVATANAAGDDPGFAQRLQAHRARRPQHWETVESAGEPAMLIDVVRYAGEAQTLLVDDLGGWTAGLLARPDAAELVEALAQAVRDSPARLVIVSPEVGLSVVPATQAGNEFADLLGSLNQAVAEVCEEVALVVAGQPAWLKVADPASTAMRTPVLASSPASAEAVTGIAAVSTPAGPPAADLPAPQVLTPQAATPQASAALSGPTMALPMLATGLVIQSNMDLPIPNDRAREEAAQQLALLDIAGAGLGSLAKVVEFAAGTQRRAVPVPWQSPRMLLVHGDHDGDTAAGQSPASSARIADAARRGEGPIGVLAGTYGISLQVVDAAGAANLEFGQVCSDESVEAALRQGWRLAEQAVDSGVDLLIVGSCGAGAEVAAAAVVASVTGAEIAGLLARVVGADGTVDDAVWMRRCAALRDGLHRVRGRVLNGKELLAELGGPDIATVAGILLGATARRTPVLLDGPVGVAAGLVARDLGSQSRLWCAMADHGQHPTTKLGADVLGLMPLLDLHVSLGEGATSLVALPLLRNALMLAATLPKLPPILSTPAGFDEEFPAEEFPAESDSEQPPGHQVEPADGTEDVEPAASPQDVPGVEPDHETDQSGAHRDASRLE